GYWLRTRRDHANAWYACNLRRDCGHQERRGKLITSAGHIATNRGERANYLSKFSTRDFPAPLARHLPLAEAPDIGGGAPQCIARFARSGVPSIVDLSL